MWLSEVQFLVQSSEHVKHIPYFMVVYLACWHFIKMFHTTDTFFLFFFLLPRTRWKLLGFCFSGLVFFFAFAWGQKLPQTSVFIQLCLTACPHWLLCSSNITNKINMSKFRSTNKFISDTNVAWQIILLVSARVSISSRFKANSSLIWCLSLIFLSQSH